MEKEKFSSIEKLGKFIGDVLEALAQSVGVSLYDLFKKTENKPSNPYYTYSKLTKKTPNK